MLVNFENYQPLLEGRSHHACANLENAILVNGGLDPEANELASPELIDLETLNPTPGPSMNSVRHNHGLALAHYNNTLTALAFGGAKWDNYWKQLDSVEGWDQESESWSMLDDLKLAESKQEVAFLSVPTKVVCQP